MFALLGTFACRDLPTQFPSIIPSPAPAGRDFTSEADYGAHNSPNSASWTGTIDTVFGGAAAGSVGTFTYWTIIETHVSGDVQEVEGVGYFYNYRWGPLGNPNAADHSGAIGLLIGGGTWFPKATTDTVGVRGGVDAFRADAMGQPIGDASHCGKPGYALCWTWTGSASLDFTRLDVEITLTRNGNARSVDSNTAVVFTVGARPAMIGSTAADVSGIKWRFEPGYADVPDDSVACTSVSGATCTRVMKTPGTMLVAAYVNGVQKQAMLKVRVARPGSPPCDTSVARWADSFDNDTALHSAWKRSKYQKVEVQYQASDQEHRRETGGFVLRDINGTDTTYSFQTWPESIVHPCTVDIDKTPTPPNAIGTYHPHRGR